MSIHTQQTIPTEPCDWRGIVASERHDGCPERSLEMAGLFPETADSSGSAPLAVDPAGRSSGLV